MADIDPRDPSSAEEPAKEPAPRTASRRDFLLLLSGAATLGMVGLTGCDDDDTTGPSSSSSSSSSSST